MVCTSLGSLLRPLFYFLDDVSYPQSVEAGYMNACMIKATGSALPPLSESGAGHRCPLARSLARRNSCGQKVRHTIEGFLAVAVLQLPASLAFPAPSASGERTR